MGSVIAITSGKGGAGKTTFAVNIGAALACRGLKTVAVDMNMGMRNLDIYMGLENKVLFDLGDVMTGVCRLDKALINDERFRSLYLLSSPQHKTINGMSAAHVKLVTKRLLNDFEYVILDCPCGLDESFVNAVSAADTALTVVTPDYVSLRNSEVVAGRLEGLGIKKRFMAINMYDLDQVASGLVPGLDKISSLSLPLAGTIPFDSSIHLANNSGDTVMCGENQALAQAFVNMALKITGRL